MVPSGSQRARSPASMQTHQPAASVHYVSLQQLQGTARSRKGTCAVEALVVHAALRVRVGHKHLRRELWALKVAARHLPQVTCWRSVTRRALCLIYTASRPQHLS